MPIHRNFVASGGKFEGQGYSFELYRTAEEARDNVADFNESVKQFCGPDDGSIYMTWAILRNGGTLGYINAQLWVKRFLMSAQYVPFDLSRVY